MKIQVFITTRFEGMHRWENAPDDVSFLRNIHRHVFHVRLVKSVSHEDRDIEFIQLKRRVDRYIYNMGDLGSCEMIASDLLRAFEADCVEVSEDGENGAIVTA